MTTHVKSVKAVKETALTILTGLTPLELAVRVINNRLDFEEQVRKQGRHMPSTDEMSAWFKLPSPVTEAQATEIRNRLTEARAKRATPDPEAPELLPAAVFLAEVDELLDDVRENVRGRRRRIAQAHREVAERRN